MNWKAHANMRQARRFLALIVIVATLLAWQPGAAVAATPIHFPQTGHALGPHFTLAWRERGALGFFGYPISEEFIDQDGEGRITQYFERAVLHYFPEHKGTP